MKYNNIINLIDTIKENNIMSFRARKIENADSIIPKKYPKGFLKIITDALIDECCLKISIDNLLFDEKKRSHFTSAYILYNKSDSVYIMKNIKNIMMK